MSGHHLQREVLKLALEIAFPEHKAGAGRRRGAKGKRQSAPTPTKQNQPGGLSAGGALITVIVTVLVVLTARFLMSRA